MTRLLAIDPGKATGWSLWEYDQALPADRTAIGVIPGGLAGFREWWKKDRPIPVGLVVVESFLLRSQSFKADITPAYILGALEEIRDGNLIKQPASRKADVGDEMLIERRLWVTGSEVNWEDGRDANDSQLHALSYLKRNHKPTAQYYWPER